MSGTCGAGSTLSLALAPEKVEVRWGRKSGQNLNHGLFTASSLRQPCRTPLTQSSATSPAARRATPPKPVRGRVTLTLTLTLTCCAPAPDWSSSRVGSAPG